MLFSYCYSCPINAILRAEMFWFLITEEEDKGKFSCLIIWLPIGCCDSGGPVLRQEQPPSVVHHEKALSLNFLAKFVDT